MFLKRFRLGEQGWTLDKLYDYEQGVTAVPSELVRDLIKVRALEDGSKWHVDLVEAIEHDALLEIELAEEKAAGESVEIETDTSVEAEREVSAEPESTHPQRRKRNPNQERRPPSSRVTPDGSWRSWAFH